MREDILFVYGTLRLGFDGPMARWLHGVARHVGPAVAQGRLYRADGYPAFVPGGEDRVIGDLFRLADAKAAFAVLDDYEECSAQFPPPHEYRRVRLRVQADGVVEDAWTYVYAWAVDGLDVIPGGDFLA